MKAYAHCSPAIGNKPRLRGRDTVSPHLLMHPTTDILLVLTSTSMPECQILWVIDMQCAPLRCPYPLNPLGGCFCRDHLAGYNSAHGRPLTIAEGLTTVPWPVGLTGTPEATDLLGCEMHPGEWLALNNSPTGTAFIIEDILPSRHRHRLKHSVTKLKFV